MSNLGMFLAACESFKNFPGGKSKPYLMIGWQRMHHCANYSTYLYSSPLTVLSKNDNAYYFQNKENRLSSMAAHAWRIEVTLSPGHTDKECLAKIWSFACQTQC